MYNKFVSEYFYLINNNEVKKLTADFNFSEVGITFCIDTAKRKILSMPTSNPQNNTKEHITEVYKAAYKKVYKKEISENDLQSHDDKFKSISGQEFKKILAQHQNVFLTTLSCQGTFIAF